MIPKFLKIFALLGLIFLLAACSPAQKSVTVNLPVVSAGKANAAAATFSDPFAYCSAVGNADTPGAEYSGPALPDPVGAGLRKAAGVAPDAPNEWFTKGSFWRCMDGKVYACFVGANLPCESKANTDKTPSAAENDFCKANPNADIVPAAVTGHDTVYEWHCKAGAPEIVKQVVQVDAQGFLANIWYPIPQP